MSRFFAGSGSDTESSSSEDELIVQKPVSAPKPTIWSDSDDDDGEKRVVKSEKDKRFDELEEIIKTSKNYRKIKDLSNTLSAFENLTKAYEKAKRVIDKEGVPRFFIRHLAELEDWTSELWEDKEGKKSMSKNNAKSLTALRQRLKKYNKDFESDILQYRENPDEYLAEQEQELEEVPEAAPAVEKKAKVPKSKEPAESDDSMDWGSSSDDSSSSDEDYDNPALKFMKKTPSEKVEKKVKVSKPKPTKVKAESDEEGWTEVSAGPRIQERPKMFAKDEEVNHAAVTKKLVEIISVRGKKGTKRAEQVSLLEELRDLAAENSLGIGLQVKIRLNIISALFDYNPAITPCMKADAWTECLRAVDELLDMLTKHPDVQLSLNISDDDERIEEQPYRVRGCIYSNIERMDTEFTKMLQACDAHSPDYVERLKDETKVCKIIDKVCLYCEEQINKEQDNKEKYRPEMCRMYLIAIKHVYYKFDKAADMGEKNTSIDKMNGMCRYIYVNDNTDRIRTQAILLHIYHLALHNKWFEARDLMLMSHLQDSVTHADVPTQICYNRCMVQLGLCAFRKGYTLDAHHCLVDVQSSGKAKELLAQGLLPQWQQDRTVEQEKIEKSRHMPYHMHINLELLECVYLVSAMLKEIPYLAAHEIDSRRRMISRNLYHVLRSSERQALVGPPESMREHVVQACKAMKRGEWKACRDYLINEKMNSKVWDLFNNAEEVRQMITSKIQEETLRTYLFTYSSVYNSLSIDVLGEMFELAKPTVHSIISKMIINEELMASLDEPTQTVVMHRTEPSRLQSIALQLSDKLGSIVENNEKLMELKSGAMFGFQPKGHDKEQQRGDRQGQHRRGQGQGNWNKNRQGGGYRQKNY